jgi:hypothetical protein
MKMTVETIVLLLLILIFLSGFVVILNNDVVKPEPESAVKCPNILLRSGNKLSLLNTKNPNVKPLFFSNLEEYKKYHDKQEKNGMSCPILYIQEENDTQGKDVYKIYSNPFDIEIGLVTMPLVGSNIEGMNDGIVKDDVLKFNKNGYTGFDAHGLNVGRYTMIDQVHESTKIENNDNTSNNAMDTEWSGIKKTETAILNGKYEKNYVMRNFPEKVIPLGSP